MESSVEFRHHLIGFVDYAFFLDAGNVWLWKSNTVDSGEDPEGDDGVFRFQSFPREIAVGGGVGLRFDFSFLILRFDLAYKLVDPGFPLGERFRLPHYQAKDLIDFGNTAVINIGIGYPF
jgi:outer membrane protein assembly factor BamA